MITIFSPTRPFESDIADVQINAIKSWLNQKHKCEIILFNDEKNTAKDYCNDLDIIVLDQVKRGLSGVPFLDSMYEEVHKISSNDIICYLTADILLPNDFSDKIIEFYNLGNNQFKKFVGISGRYDLTDKNIKKNSLSEDEYYNLCSDNCYERGRSGIDLWITNKNDDIDFLPFPIGRCLTDNWFVYHCRKNNFQVIDLSKEIKIIHQNHSKPSKTNDFFILEKIHCHLIFENASENGMDIYDSDFLYYNNKFIRPTGLRKLYYILSTNKIYRKLLGLRRMYRNKLYKIQLEKLK